MRSDFSLNNKNPVRGLLDRKRLEEHLQSSNENMKKKEKKKGSTSEKYSRALGRESLGIVPAARHLIPSPDRNHAPKRLASTTPSSQDFRFL